MFIIFLKVTTQLKRSRAKIQDNIVPARKFKILGISQSFIFRVLESYIRQDDPVNFDLF